MVAHRVEAVVEQNGTLTVHGVPFQPGERVEVLIRRPEAVRETVRFPLPGPYRFDDPFTPVGVEDWDALR
jgi:hypothetical protein